MLPPITKRDDEGVVGDDALQVELEIAVAGIDDLDRRNHEIGGGHDGAT